MIILGGGAFKQTSSVNPHITATITADSNPVNFTSLGAADYLIYRAGQTLANGYKKSGGGGLITVTEYDPSNVYSLDEQNKAARTYTATDATPSNPTNVIANARVVNYGTNQQGGVNIVLPAGIATRTAKLYVMGYGNIAEACSFSAVCTLSDSSASQTTSFTGATNADNFLRIDLDYSAAANSQTLNVIWRLNTCTTSAVRAAHFGGAWVSS